MAMEQSGMLNENDDEKRNAVVTIENTLEI